jgi:hypothetical protein
MAAHFELGTRVLVRWPETGDCFIAKIKQITIECEDLKYEIEYEEKVRGKNVVENQVTPERIRVAPLSGIKNIANVDVDNHTPIKKPKCVHRDIIIRLTTSLLKVTFQ